MFNVPVLYFFEGMSVFLKEGKQAGVRKDKQDGDTVEAKELDYIFASKETIKLLNAYYAISDAKKRKKVFEFLSTMQPKSVQSE